MLIICNTFKHQSCFSSFRYFYTSANCMINDLLASERARVSEVNKMGCAQYGWWRELDPSLKMGVRTLEPWPQYTERCLDHLYGQVQYLPLEEVSRLNVSCVVGKPLHGLTGVLFGMAVEIMRGKKEMARHRARHSNFGIGEAVHLAPNCIPGPSRALGTQ